jgi:hypothetical protein
MVMHRFAVNTKQEDWLWGFIVESIYDAPSSAFSYGDDTAKDGSSSQRCF